MSSVFSAGPRRDLHSHIARLCVLSEDLRIEIGGLNATQIDEMDELGRKARSLYFLRRSMGTLFEFAGAIARIEALPEFSIVKDGFGPMASRHWAKSVRFFHNNQSRIARLRHHVGGHFGQQAAEHAIDTFGSTECGCIERAFYSDEGIDLRLCFSQVIAATAYGVNVGGPSTIKSGRDSGYRTLLSYRHAMRAVGCIVACYLWDRFGR